jgi:hypothetical protein
VAGGEELSQYEKDSAIIPLKHLYNNARTVIAIEIGREPFCKTPDIGGYWRFVRILRINPAPESGLLYTLSVLVKKSAFPYLITRSAQFENHNQPSCAVTPIRFKKHWLFEMPVEITDTFNHWHSFSCSRLLAQKVRMFFELASSKPPFIL